MRNEQAMVFRGPVRGMNALFAGIFTVALTLILVCWSVSLRAEEDERSQPKSGEEKTFKTYSGDGLTFEYPGDWELSTLGFPGWTVVGVNTVAGHAERASGGLSIMVFDPEEPILKMEDVRWDTPERIWDVHVARFHVGWKESERTKKFSERPAEREILGKTRTGVTLYLERVDEGHERIRIHEAYMFDHGNRIIVVQAGKGAPTKREAKGDLKEIDAALDRIVQSLKYTPPAQTGRQPE